MHDSGPFFSFMDLARIIANPHDDVTFISHISTPWLRHNAYCLVLDGQSDRAPKVGPEAAKAKVASGAKAAHS